MAANLTQYCPAALYAGGCTTPGCRLLHTARLCQPCGVLCDTQYAYKRHTHKKAHRNNINANASESTKLPFCVICERDIGFLHVWNSHITGKHHRKAASRKGLSPSIAAPEASQLARLAQYCSLCSLTLLKTHWAHHVQTVSHKRREAIAAHRGAFERAEEDKEGVVVAPEGEVDFGVVQPDRSRGGVHKVLVLHLAAGAPNVKLEKVEVLDRTNHVSTS